jgi:hypothetical protein
MPSLASYRPFKVFVSQCQFGANLRLVDDIYPWKQTCAACALFAPVSLRIVHSTDPGEIVRIAPLGRVAHIFFHEQARTIHSTMRLWNNIDSWNESDVVRHLAANSIETLSKMKVVIGLEMFMMGLGFRV